MRFGTWIKQAGVHKHVIGVWRRDATGYKIVNTIDIKNASGLYKRAYALFPRGAICIFNAAHADQASWTNVYDGYYPKMSAHLMTSLITGGATTHQHGAAGGTSVSISNPYSINNRNLGASGRKANSTGHAHTIPAHTHGAATNLQRYAGFKAYTGVETIVAGTIIFSAVAINDPANWTYLALDSLMRFDAAQLGHQIGAWSHTHPLATWSTSTFVESTSTDSYERDFFWNRSHYHTVSENSTTTLALYYTGMNLYICTTDGAEVPVGGRFFLHHTTSVIPAGYKLVTEGIDGRYIRMGQTAGVAGGSDPLHTEPGPDHIAASTLVQTVRGEAQSGSDHRSINAHDHTPWSHTHPVASQEPPFVQLATIEKI